MNKLKGIHSYDILANPTYSFAFKYVSAAKQDREDYINDDKEGNSQSDLVRAVLGLAYLKDIENFKFDPDYLTKLKNGP